MNSTAKKVLKWVLVVVALCGAVGFLFHFVLGVYRSCVGDDIITAQNRIASAYQFLYMVAAGGVMVAGLIPATFIKERILPEKIRKLFFTKDEK